MKEVKKVFPVRLTEEQHTLFKEAAEGDSKSLHQFFIDAAENEVYKAQTFHLIMAAYKYIKGGSNTELENNLFDWIIDNKQ